jgi:hypothetical protein
MMKDGLDGLMKQAQQMPYHSLSRLRTNTWQAAKSFGQLVD